MKIWVTRPELTTLCSRGIGFVDLWIVKPTFNRNPRGARDLRIFAELPIGWQVIDPQGVDITAQCSVREDKMLADYPDILSSVWDAIVMDVDGHLPDGCEMKRWLDRFCKDPSGMKDYEALSRFCHEADVPPELWFRIAVKNGWEHQTFASRHYQTTFDAFDADPSEDTQYRRIAP